MMHIYAKPHPLTVLTTAANEWLHKQDVIGYFLYTFKIYELPSDKNVYGNNDNTVEIQNAYRNSSHKALP